MRQGRVGALLAGLLLFPAIAGAAESRDEGMAGTRATMQGLFGSLQTAFILSLNLDEYQVPKNRKQIQASLDALAANANSLEAHGQPLSHSYDFLRSSLAADAREAGRRYRAGEYESSQFVLHQITENCFACHTRLPSAGKFDLGAGFISKSQREALPLEARVKLAVATRRFNTALATCEMIFRSSEIPAAEIELMGAFEDYLKIMIRVESDYGRAISALEQFSKRPDVPGYLQGQLEAWIASLRALGREKAGKEGYERAKQLIKKGQLQNRFPADRRGLVYFVAASGILHHHVNQKSERESDLAEPYYLLGVAESYIGNSFWISETEFFLETAIRLAPGSPVAKQAYAFLEDFTIREFTGSGGEDLPEDVQASLGALRDLSEGKVEGKAQPTGRPGT